MPLFFTSFDYVYVNSRVFQSKMMSFFLSFIAQKLNIFFIKMYGAACRTLHYQLIVFPFIAALNVVNVTAVFHFTSLTPPAGPCGNKKNTNYSGRGIELLSESVIYIQVVLLMHLTVCLYPGIRTCEGYADMGFI